MIKRCMASTIAHHKTAQIMQDYARDYADYARAFIENILTIVLMLLKHGDL